MLKIAYSPIYCHPLPPGHRFPMEKYELLPGQLLYEGTVTEDNFFEPGKIDEQWILKAHSAVYWEKLKSLNLSKSEIRATGFPLSRDLVDREVTILQGSVQAAIYALEYGIGMNIAGGTHHAFTDRGEGFCLLNDIAVTAHYLLDQGLPERVLVVDLDVHQGNGTAQIFQNDPRVFTFSMHGEKNYPHKKELSDIDVPLADGIRDGAYLDILKRDLGRVMEKFRPDFVIYQSGVDILASDQLGRLGLSMQGVKDRDYFVLGLARSQNIPIMCCMGGGYSSNVRMIVDAHSQVYRAAQELYF